MASQSLGLPAAEVGNENHHHADLLSLGVGALTSLAAREANDMRDDHRMRTLFKSELDALEDKISRQMSSFRGQLMKLGERLTEAYLVPIQGKVNALEARERSVDCQLSDLSGSVKGLMDEMQLQVRRADKVDAKFRHWRKVSEEGFASLEEQLRNKPQSRPQSNFPTPRGGRSTPTQSSFPSQAPPLEAVTRPELFAVIESLRMELGQEIRAAVDAAVRQQHSRDREAGVPRPGSPEESFDWLRQDQHQLTAELAQVTRQVKAQAEEDRAAEQDRARRFEDAMQDLSRKLAAPCVVPPSRGGSELDLPGLAAAVVSSGSETSAALFRLEEACANLQDRSDDLDVKVNRLLSGPSMQDMDSVTERLARLAGRVCVLETPQPELASCAPVSSSGQAVPDLGPDPGLAAPKHFSPPPGVTRLDLSSVQAGSPVPSAQMAAWQECGYSPDMSLLSGTDVACITAHVEDAVWTRLKGHFFQMVKSQEDLVEHMGAVHRDQDRSPDLLRLYQTVNDVVEELAARREDPEPPAAEALAGKDPHKDHPEFVHMWRDELMKLWRVLSEKLEHIEHLQNLLTSNDKQAAAPTLDSPEESFQVQPEVPSVVQEVPEPVTLPLKDPDAYAVAPVASPRASLLPRGSLLRQELAQPPPRPSTETPLPPRSPPPQPPTETLPNMSASNVLAPIVTEVAPELVVDTMMGSLETKPPPEPMPPVPKTIPGDRELSVPVLPAMVAEPAPEPLAPGPPPTSTLQAPPLPPPSVDPPADTIGQIYITKADLEEQWKKLRVSSEAIVIGNARMKSYMAEVRSMAEAHKLDEERLGQCAP